MQRICLQRGFLRRHSRIFKGTIGTCARAGNCEVGDIAYSPHDIRSAWVKEAFRTIYRLDQRESTTPMIQLEDHQGGYPSFSKGENGIDLYIKNEVAENESADAFLYLPTKNPCAALPSGSLKHRLARSLFMYALATGQLRENMTIVEASSGSTAISEAWFARRLGLSYISVVAKSTAKEKIEAIESLGGECVLVESTAKIYDKCEEIVKELNEKAKLQPAFVLLLLLLLVVVVVIVVIVVA
eukprot:jgi/Bigna1/68375/fgenesh1_pg.6_\